jgi:CDP-glucose 4,6-dehydratase
MDLEANFSGRRVLVTGHTGFKGSWLTTWLLKLGASVSGLALPPSEGPTLFTVQHLDAQLAESGFADIRDFAAVEAIIARAEPEIVFHLAAQPLVRRSYVDPIETFATNVLGTAHLMEACRRTASVRAIVNVTTDKVYENREWPWPYRETDPLGGLDPYSASKACAELVSQVYQKNLCRGEHVIEIATARGGNVIGGGDWSTDRIVPDILRALTESRPIFLRNPGAIRPWQHVLELCEGYLELGARLLAGDRTFAEAWNFGPKATSEIPVRRLTDAILQTWGRPDHPVHVETSSLHEAQTLRLDISKSVSRLFWKPRLGIDQTLAWTAEWYRTFYEDPAAARRLTSDQIAAFGAMRLEEAGAIA